jgi:hypothetical protein
MRGTPTARELTALLGLHWSGREWHGNCPSCGYGNEGARQKGRALLPAMTATMSTIVVAKRPATVAEWLSVAMGRHF